MLQRTVKKEEEFTASLLCKQKWLWGDTWSQRKGQTTSPVAVSAGKSGVGGKLEVSSPSSQCFTAQQSDFWESKTTLYELLSCDSEWGQTSKPQVVFLMSISFICLLSFDISKPPLQSGGSLPAGGSLQLKPSHNTQIGTWLLAGGSLLPQRHSCLWAKIYGKKQKVCLKARALP